MTTILVVDDEPDMLDILSAFLAPDYVVLTAADVPSAEIVLRDAACDLVVTDIRMPGASGRVLVELLRRTRPSLPIVVVSGSERDDSLPVSRWLAKPFRRDELREAVRRALAG